MDFGRHVVRWIEVARTKYGADWLPSDADMSKSALLERLRSGLEPLPEPPPVGMACPWYAVVEDAGPHYVFDVWFGNENDQFFKADDAVILQHGYKIVERRGDKDFIIKDRSDTSYRFRLWHDAEWKHPSGRIVGGWFMQNTAFSAAKGHGL